jgi:hypothetical protein
MIFSTRLDRRTDVGLVIGVVVSVRESWWSHLPYVSNFV